MERYMAHLLKGAEIRTQYFLDASEKDPRSPQYGGMKGDIREAKPTIYALTTAIAVYVNKKSRFYQNGELYEAINLALDFVRHMQRRDGNFDFPISNFMSAADTSFCFKRLIAAYRLLERYGCENGSEMSVLKDNYMVIMHHALEAIMAGGFHTPNHRWGIAAALLQGAGLFRTEEEFAKALKERAAQYLAEGIDGDEDGEYAERSTGNYNAVVNNAMMAMYEESGDETYLGYIRRNLTMMLTYIDPDDTIFTQNSTRQDNGKQEFADKYFYQYLFMCSREQNPAFDGAAHKIIRDNQERGGLAPDCLHIIMLHPEMMTHHFGNYGFLPEYRKFYQNSGVLRVKKENYTYTVLKDKSAFLFLKSGSTMVYVKIGESYCDIRNFIPGDIRVEAGRCTLEGTAEGWYYLPFKEPQKQADWWKMDHSKREKLVNSSLTITVTIEELENGLELEIKTSGLDGLPLRLETCIPAGAVLEHEAFWKKAAAGEEMILRDGHLKIREGLTALQIGPGFGEHEFQGHYSGEEINAAGCTVYCNAYTPCERRFRLCVET